MALIYRHKSWDRKPTKPTPLNWSNEFVARSIFSINFLENGGNSTEPNYLRKYPGVLSFPVYPQTFTANGTDYKWSGDGISFNETSTSTLFETLTGVDSFAGSTASYSFATRIYVGSFVSQGSSFNAIFTVAGVLAGRSLGLQSDGKLYVFNSAQQAVALTANSVAGKWVDVVLVINPSATSYAYVNGVKTSFTSGGNPVASGTKLSIGGESGSTNRYFRGKVSHLLVCDFAFTDDHANSIINNPWQIFKPQKRILYFDFGGFAADLLASASLSDTHSAGIITSSSITSTATLVGDTLGYVSMDALLTGSSAAEAIAACSLIATRGMTEASAASATESMGLSTSPTQNEALTLSDVVAAVSLLQALRDEAAAAASDTSALKLTAGVMQESQTLTDSALWQVGAIVELLESVSSSATPIGLANLVASNSEPSTAADGQSSVFSVSRSLLEQATLGDSGSSQTFQGMLLIAAAAALDAVQGLASMGSVIISSASAGHSSTAQSTVLSSLVEAALLDSTLQHGAVFGRACAEPLSAADAQASVVSASAAILAAVNAQDFTSQEYQSGIFALAEVLTASDGAQALADVYAALSAQATAQDLVTVLDDLLGAVREYRVLIKGTRRSVIIGRTNPAIRHH